LFLRPIFQHPASGGGPASQLTDYASSWPSVSPDGKWIACVSIPGQNQPVSLAVVPFAGGQPAKVFPLPVTYGSPLHWTPEDPSQWQTEGSGSKSDSKPCENAAELARRGGLMRLLYRQGVNNPDFSRLEGPQGKAVWTDLWLRAFGPGGEGGNSEIGNRRASFKFPSSNTEIVEMAEITWDRIQMLLQHREQE
jgi:hypothetical protein